MQQKEIEAEDVLNAEAPMSISKVVFGIIVIAGKSGNPWFVLIIRLSTI